MNLSGGLVLLQEVLADLPAAEKRIAEYILANARHVVTLTITELASSCDASAAGVVRLCKRLHMKGYRELKLRVAMDLSQESDSRPLLRLGPGTSARQIIDSIIHNNDVSLSDLRKVLDSSVIETAADKMARARRVDIYGAGASGIVAMDLYQKLLRIGLSCFYDSDGHMQITSACTLTAEDVAVAVSYSGETGTTVAAAAEATASGATVISITRFSENALASMAPVNLFVPSTEPLMREGAMSSRITQLVVIDILFTAVATRLSDRIYTSLARSRNAVRGRGY